MPTVVVKCGLCSGSGTYNNFPCSACGGDGGVKVPTPPLQCGRCRGTGKEASYPQAVCPGCDGTGWVRR